MAKKLLSIALSLCMILTMFSFVTVSAAGEDVVAKVVTSDEGDGSFAITFASTATNIGSFGVKVEYDNVKYTLESKAKNKVMNADLYADSALVNAPSENSVKIGWSASYGMQDANDENVGTKEGAALAANSDGLYEIATIKFKINKDKLVDADYDNKLKITFTDYSFGVLDAEYNAVKTIPTETSVEFNIPDTRTEIEGLTATATEGHKYTGTAFDAKTLITVNALETDTVEYTTVPAEVKNAGDYKVTATVKRAGYKPTAVSADVTIGKADTTITIASDEITYGETEYTKDFTVADGVDKAEITVSDYTVSDLNAGEKEITATATSANYNVTVTAGTLTVNKADTTITIADAEITYGDTEYTKDFTVADGVDKAEITVSDYTVSDLNAGEKEITATATSANYNVTVTAGTLTVNKKPLTITAQNEFQVQGNGQLAEFKPAVVEGLVEGDEITNIVVGLKDAYTDAVGDYAIEVKSYDDNANYEITTVEGIYSIKTAIPVNVAFGENKKTYGDADGDIVVTVTKGEDTADASSLVTITRKANEAAGTHADAYEVALNVDTDEETGLPYALNITGNTYVIEPKAATINIANAEKKVGTVEDPAFSATYEGFLEGEEPAEITFTREAGETAGEYAITTAYADPNYAITVNNGTLTISKYALTVKAPTVTVKLGNAVPTLAAVIEGAADGDTITATVTVKNDVPEVVDPALIDTTVEAVYTTEATSDADLDKYDVTYVPGTLTVRKSSSRPSGGGVIKPATKPEEDKKDDEVKDDENKPTASANIALKEDAKDVNFVVADEENKFNPDVNASRNDVVAAISAIFDVTDVKNAPTFTDTEDEAIKALAAAGVIDGYTDGSFKGEKDITRAEFVKLLAAALKLEEVEGATANFSDIDGHWAAEWIKTFVSKGYLVGYPDGTFRPDNNITRAEMVVVITRVTDAVAGDAAVEFADVDASHWAYDYIMKAAK